MATIYKQNTRTLRQVNTETNYNKGMFFVNTPLTEGYSKLLVNFDFSNDGASLVPRRGLRTTKIIRPGAGPNSTLAICNTTTHLNPDREAGYSDAFRRVDQLVMEGNTASPLAFEDPADAAYYFIKNNVEHYRDLTLLQCFPEGTDDYASFYGADASDNLKALHKLSYEYPLISDFEYYLHSKQFLNNKSNAQGAYLMVHDCPLITSSPTFNTASNTPEHLNKPGFVGTFAWDNNLIYPVLYRNDVYTYKKVYVRANTVALDPDWLSETPNGALYTPAISNTDLRYLIVSEGTYYGTVWLPRFTDTVFTGWEEAGFAIGTIYDFAINTKISSPLSSHGFSIFGSGAHSYKDPSYYFKMFDKNIGSSKKIEPKALTPAEAVQWGYNMLADNPYMFESRDADAEGVAQILGVLPYYSKGDNAELALKAIVGEQVYFKIFCAAAATDTDYIVRLSIRNLASSEFTTIYENHHAGTELSRTITTALPHTIAYEQFIMKAEIVQPIVPTTVYMLPNTAVRSAAWLSLTASGTALTPELNKTYILSAAGTTWDGNIYRWNGMAYYENPYEQQENQIHTSVVSFNFAKARQNGSSALVKLRKYTIPACSGMAFWQNRLVVWGVPEDPTILFLSELNNPAYFPYPNNISTFNEPILKAVPFNNFLLVFTATQLWQLVLNPDGLTWTQTCLQNNLKITEADTALILTTNTMVFFKSGNYYYMMVPSMKTVGSLVLAPISKPIEKFFDNFSDNIAQLMMSVYNLDIKNSLNKNMIQTSVDGVDANSKGVGYLRRFALAKCTTELLFEDICINYTFYAEESADYHNYITVTLRYNTASRTWRTYVLDTPAPYVSVSRSSVGTIDYVCTFSFQECQKWWHDNGIGEPHIETGTDGTYPRTGVQYLAFMPNDCADCTLDDGSIFTDTWQTTTFFAPPPMRVLDYHTGSPAPIVEETTVMPGPSLLNNWQFLDTGNREQMSTIKKRYRECRVSLNNLSPETLQFSLEFMIDNEVRVPMYTPTCTITDGVATLTYEAGVSLTTDMIMAGRTQVSDTDTNPSYTRIHVGTEGSGSVFTYPYIAKIFTPVSGKGFAPRFKLLSKNVFDYEILSHDWVFRTMNAR